MAEEEIGARLKLKDRKQFSHEAKKASDSVEDIGDKTEDADKKMRTMGGSGGGTGILSKGLGGLLGVAKVGAVVIGGLAVSLGAASVKFIGMASDAAETASAFNTVFGPSAEGVQEFVDSINQTYGIPVDELQDASRQFGVFAKAAGLPQEALQGFSTDLLQAGLDMGSFYNAAPEDVFRALQGGLTGEAEPLRKFGIFMSDAALNAFALKEGISKTTQEMTDGEKVALRQKFIMASLGDAQGDLERTSGGLANQWRGLTGRMKSAGTAIGTALLPVAGKLVTALNDRLAPIVNELTRTAPMVGEAFAASFKDGDVTTEFWSLVGIAERLAVAAKWLKEQWDNLSGAFKTGGIHGVTEELDSMMGTGTLLTDTVGSLLSIFDSLGKIWEDLILPVLKDFNKAIPRGIRPLQLVAKTLEWIADHGKTLQPILAGLLAGFIAFRVVTGIIKAITIAQAAWNAVLAMNPIGLIVIAIAALAAGLIYAWQNSETFREVVTGAFDTVKGVVMGVYNWFKDNWPLLLAILTGPFGLAVYEIVQHWDDIKGGATAVKDWITEKFDEIVGFFTGLPDRITDAAAGMFDGIKDAFRGAVNWIIDAWNGLEFSLPEVDTHIPGVGKVGGWSLGTPDIPRLHSGGTTVSGGAVNMLPGEELVILPPAASVVPLSDNVKSMAAAMTGNREPVVLQVVLDRKVIAEAVYDHTGDEVARR